MNPQYNLEKIKFGTDAGSWIRAINLYENGKIKNFQDAELNWIANVQGTNLYKVIVSKKGYTDGDCSCYLGQNDTLCKHMVAVAIYGLKKGLPLTEAEKVQHNEIKFNGKIGEINQANLILTKAAINFAMRYIKAYRGPSKIWFTYQDNLTEGCNRLAAIFSTFPAGRLTTNLAIKTLLKLDKKLTAGGVDDSDGIIGGFIEESVNLLIEFAKINPECAKEFELLREQETCSGWEEPLLNFGH
ncbi:MAG: SWIM-type protein [Candidatus Levybacteria bacterium]|nr:SWIM-type protein [Candidatus Levybacteria bacterium]